MISMSSISSFPLKFRKLAARRVSRAGESRSALDSSWHTVRTRPIAPYLKLFSFSLLLGISSSVQGAIVYFANQEIPIPTTFEGVSIDLETGASETDMDGVAGGDANFVLGGGGVTNDADQGATVASWQPVRTGPSNIDPVGNLISGVDVVDGTSMFSTGFGGSGDPNSHFPPFVSGTSGYIGFSLVLANSNVVYGWMNVTLMENNAAGGVIHEWAYDDTGGPITVGIPEPDVLVLGLLGCGLFLGRRKR